MRSGPNGIPEITSLFSAAASIHVQREYRRCSLCFALSIPAFVGLIVSLFSLGFASTAWAASAFSVAAFDSLRTFRAEEKPTDGKPHIMIEAARGETESFQVAVSNHTNATLSDLTVVAEGLPGQVEIYASGSVLVDKPGRSTGAVPGRYFDLLRPVGWESIAPGEYMPYWVDVHVLEDTAPGPMRDGLPSWPEDRARAFP